MQLRDATILVVDDEPYYRDIATEWLQREGCRVLVAEDGRQGLARLERDIVDAIVTDIRMPVMDGSDFVTRVKAKGIYTPTAISISGFSDLSPREAFDLGIESQLSKPVSRQGLVSTLEQALLDREELWSLPPKPGSFRALDANFHGVAGAVGEELIAFGRGGFCIRTNTPFPEGATLAFQLSFEAEQKTVSGQAVIRWVADREQLVGIEITRVREEGRSWLASLTGENRTVSFIPRTTLWKRVPQNAK